MVTQNFGNCRGATPGREAPLSNIERRLDDLTQLLIAQGLLQWIDLPPSEQERLKDKVRLIKEVGPLFADVIEI